LDWAAGKHLGRAEHRGWWLAIALKLAFLHALVPFGVTMEASDVGCAMERGKETERQASYRLGFRMLTGRRAATTHEEEPRRGAM